MNSATGAIVLLFSGVISFIPERQDSNLVNALLINVAGHKQRLRVSNLSFQPGQYCPTQGGYCRVVAGNFCDCPLSDGSNPPNGVTVSILDLRASKQTLPTQPPGILPKQQNVGSIEWLVNMWYVKPNAARVVQAHVLDNVGGRVSFNWHEAATCRFEEALCNNQRRIFAVRFVVAPWGNRRQAVPESVVFKAMVATAQARIQLKKRGSAPAFLDLNCPADAGCPVSIINSMGGADDTQILCTICYEDRETTHFREFRRLSSDIFGVAPYRLCERVNEDYVDLEDDLPRLCTQGVDRLNLKMADFDAISNRVICPAAIMIP